MEAAHLAGVLLGATKCDRLPLGLGVHAVWCMCGLELGVIPVLRPVAVGRGVDVGTKRGVLELVTGVVVGVGRVVLDVETGVVAVDVLGALEDPVEAVDPREELVDELVEEPADPVESSPAAKSFGPGI